MERHFDDELKELNNKILRMATLSEDAIKLAIEALKNRDEELAKKVINNDCIIDKFELEIDDFSIALLATRQPLAKDLRFITTATKINSELERIADLAVNISHKTLDLSVQNELKKLVKIPVLAELAITMVKDSIDSFVNRNLETAKNVINLDKQANELRNTIHRELIEDYIIKDPSTASRAILLFLVAQHLERICDHAKYIAQDVIYLVCAKDVRHKKGCF